ncbi:MAG TPA: hypothetical protein VFZ00_27310 [Solirubrobacter sp.]|nr:hypothetical protein [Solirubrobacter sp.]
MTRVLFVFAVLSALLAAPAHAQAPRVSDFDLRPGATDLPERVEGLGKQLPRRSINSVLTNANRPATPNGDCAKSAFTNMPAGSRWYCFDPADSANGGNAEWYPQGVSTSADAGTGGREAILVSWYDSAQAPAKGVRVSFLDTATNSYRHVLLVYPYINGAGKPTYEIVGRPQGGIHAGGIVWHGNQLYVVDTTRGIRVFDMRQIFEIGSNDSDKIGLRGSKYHGFGYRYVMPQVGAWVNDAGPDNDGNHTCEAHGAPKFSSIGYDNGALITSEYCRANGAYGRVARWSLKPDANGHLRATEALRLPVHNVQGAVSAGGTYYLSRSRGEDTHGQLIPATPKDGKLVAGTARRAGIGPEDLSYWPGRNELWTVTEHPGKRMLYGVPR